MAETGEYAVLKRSVAQHFAGIEGVLASRTLVRSGKNQWVSVAGKGEIDPDVAMSVLQNFDADGGGSVQPVKEGPATWLASYFTGGAGVDLCLLFSLSDLPPDKLETLLASLEAKAGWLLVAALKDHSSKRDSIALSVDIGSKLLIDAARARSRAALADQWIARLEKALKPDVMAVTWVRADVPKLAGVSGGSLVDRQSVSRAALEKLAEQAIDGRSVQLYRQGEVIPPQVADAMASLNAKSAMILPIYLGDNCQAVVPVFWSDTISEMPNLDAADIIAQVLGEALSIFRRARPSIFRRLSNWAAGLFRAIFGKRAARLKLIFLAIAVLTAIAAFVPTPSRPAFEALIEARDRSIVSAPFDGFLVEAPLELGDRADIGDTLVALEDTDFKLEFARAEAEVNRISSEMQTARARRETAQVRVLEAQMQQTIVQRDLLSHQLDQTRITAQTKQIVVGGDAWRRIGARVRLGDPLIELARPGSIAVRAFIDETWVLDIPGDATASVLLAAFPDQPIPVQLERITTEAQMRDGTNAFSTWFAFEAPPELGVLVGMRGIVRVDVGPSNYLREYTRGPVLWAKSLIWRWQ